MYSLHRDCLSIPSVLSLRSDRRATTSTFGGINRGKLVSHLDVRVFGRAYSIQQRGGDPVNFEGWLGRAALGEEGTLYAVGPCVVYERRRTYGRRFELVLGRFALSF